MTAVFADPVAELIARTRINDTMNRYCRGIDRFDENLVRSAYHPGATDDHGSYVGDAEGFLAFQGKWGGRLLYSSHLITNAYIEFRSPTQAWVEFNCLAYQAVPVESDPERQTRRVILVRYLDVFEERDGDWRIARRRCVYTDAWNEEGPRRIDMPAAAKLQRRDRDDSVYDPDWPANW